jgi:hypothetical protein
MFYILDGLSKSVVMSKTSPTCEIDSDLSISNNSRNFDEGLGKI